VSFSANNTYNFIYGESRKLNIDILPSTAPNKQTTWSSSNLSVATVANDGTVTAKSVTGTATITVTTVDGNRTATHTVNVKPATVLLDLAAVLQSQTDQVLNWGTFYSIFENKITAGGAPGSNSDDVLTYEDEYGNTISVNAEARYEIITENGVKKLQFIDYEGWCPGINLEDAAIGFQVGDVIQIKGTLTKINSKCNGVLFNLDTWGWKQLQGWWGNVGAFEKTFTLTQEDIDGGPMNGSWSQDIKGNHPAGVRFRTNVDEDQSWTKRYPDGVGVIVIEQIKIYGYRD